MTDENDDDDDDNDNNSDGDELSRRFEGRAVLDGLLAGSGSLADTEDVVGAFETAAKDGVPAPVVIQALWEDEPRFESPAQAARLFGNLLALFDLVASGASVELGATPAGLAAKRLKAPKPAPFGADGPDDDFVEAAWRYLDDFPRERERLEHTFDNRQDELVSWLDAQGLDDAAFALARALLADVHAMLVVGGRACPAVRAKDVPAEASLPEGLARWVDEGVFEAEQHDEAPLPEATGEALKSLVARAASALWLKSK